MTTKHEIDIPDLPEGWRAVAYRIPSFDDYIFVSGKIARVNAVGMCVSGCLIVEKIKPRRIVFEATNEFRQAVKGDWVQFCDCTDNFQRWGDLEPSTSKYKLWRVVEEE